MGKRDINTSGNIYALTTCTLTHSSHALTTCTRTCTHTRTPTHTAYSHIRALTHSLACTYYMPAQIFLTHVHTSFGYSTSVTPWHYIIEQAGGTSSQPPSTIKCVSLGCLVPRLERSLLCTWQPSIFFIPA